jgi:hypothetical protein
MAVFSRGLGSLEPFAGIGGEFILIAQHGNVQRLRKNFINRSSEKRDPAARTRRPGELSEHLCDSYTKPSNAIAKLSHGVLPLLPESSFAL